jgi:acyl carrier protein
MIVIVIIIIIIKNENYGIVTDTTFIAEKENMYGFDSFQAMPISLGCR